MITAASSGIGVICVLLCGLYFMMVFPVRVGTTVLGYMILLGLLVVYSVNFLFVLPPTVSICWLRRIGMSLGYCTILSGMLVKAMNTWRRMSYKIKQRNDEPVQITSPTGLLFIASGLVAVHLFVTIVWLYLFPPKPSLYEGTWKCYPAQSFMIDTESVVSLLYIILLIFLIIFFCILTWKSYDNHREPRFIFYSCASIAVIWTTWIIVSYKNFLSSKNRSSLSSSSSTTTTSSSAGIESRDLTIICANLTSASLVMILLYLRKLYWYSRIRRKDRLIRSRLQTANFPANFYGALHTRNYAHNWQTDAGSSYTGPSTATSSVRGSISSVAALTLRNGNGCIIAPDGHGNPVAVAGGASNAKRKNSTKKPFQDDDEQMDDGTMSCASAASSVQVQGEDLYPMEVYDCGSQFQPSSLFSTANGKVYSGEN